MLKYENTVAVLGSTGSVGTQALEVAEHLGMKVSLLVAGSNISKMEEQARKFHPSVCVMQSEAAAARLRTALRDTDSKVFGGENALADAIANDPSHTVLHSISGCAGLAPAMTAARCGKRIAMANKEAIVIAGDMLHAEIKANGAELIPVDSEHSAIFQCLKGNHHAEVSRLWLTASGGAFRGKKREDLAHMTAKEALAHPTWRMGPKITVDSASLMNKGFEVIEAVRLFGVRPDQVKVVVQPESIIHSMVEYIDNAVIAQIGAPDMRECIQYAFTYPNRCPSLAEKLDFAKLAALHFAEPDTDTFRLLPLAFYAIEQDGVLPCVLNAADEVAVDAFLHDKLGFLGIMDVVEQVVTSWKNHTPTSLEDLFAVDREARAVTAKQIGG
ncbi:MAG: 1-deoxy-D-xylulose-5-phosphate reductoisomerase [Clostridia bacterium]|nr:1-deoxy-D-xylulose-5-phosphate reductoisomerase [Clostridia bacterium]